MSPTDPACTCYSENGLHRHWCAVMEARVHARHDAADLLDRQRRAGVVIETIPVPDGITGHEAPPSAPVTPTDLANTLAELCGLADDVLEYIDIYNNDSPEAHLLNFLEQDAQPLLAAYDAQTAQPADQPAGIPTEREALAILVKAAEELLNLDWDRDGVVIENLRTCARTGRSALDGLDYHALAKKGETDDPAELC